MKKTLLLCAAALFAFAGRMSAGDGLTTVGANIILLPSSQYDGDIEWKAWTWVCNSGVDFGNRNTDNPNYNNVLAWPATDKDGLEWYQPGYDMSAKEADENPDTYEPIVWEEHTAPFSSDETYNGKRSYQWTTGSIMADIYVRRTFVLDAGQLLTGPVYLTCGHDDAPAKYYINGELVFEATDGWNNSEYIMLTDEQKALIKLNGEENVIAFHVHQNWGGAFADCGLYTKLDGGLDMGFDVPWEGKVLFNNTGGYNFDGQSPSNNPRHPWSALYEAQEGDEYTFTLNSSCSGDYYEPWMEQLQFKTPIRIEKDHSYRFQARVLTDKTFENFIVKLAHNSTDPNPEGEDADKDINLIELAYDDFRLEAPYEGEEDYEGTLIELDIEPDMDVSDFKVIFDFGGGQDTTTVTIKDMSLLDTTDDDKELWIGSSYFNYFNMHKTVIKYRVYDWDLNDGNGGYRDATEEEIESGEVDIEEEVSYVEIDAPEMTGRVETLSWTLPDFDDSMWDNQMMPVGNMQYGLTPVSNWPGYGSNFDYEGDGGAGENTNYWIRRNFEMDNINENYEYQLNVLHDDVYETYVNGHLLQKNVGWTSGKSPKQVHIPARYLNIGKNVIATYIQQNWGGRFYDCGINVVEVDYNNCLRQFNEALAYAKTDTLLTKKMHADVDALIERANQFFEDNKNDAAELRAYARDSIRPNANTIFSYSSTVKALKETYEVCNKLEDKGYWGTTRDDALVALDTCATSGQINPYLNALREARKANAAERHTEKYVGCAPQAVSMENVGLTELDDPSLPRYYIYNVGAKQFLGGGESWGTHLALEYISNAMMLIQATKAVVDEYGEPTDDVEPIEGAFYVETFRPNGEYGIGDFMGWNGFIDVAIDNPQGTLWEIVPVEGKENVYNIARYGETFGAADTTCYNGTIFEPGGKKLLGLRSGDNRYAPSYYVVDTDMHSPELETNQWMFISREELLGFIATASEENPVDLSFLIQNPGYDQRLSIDAWYFNNGQVLFRGDDHPDFVLESYSSFEFNNYQEMWPEEGEDALPAGTYKLMVQGYYRDGIEKAHFEKVLNDEPISQRAIIFAGSELYSDNPDACEIQPLMPINVEANKVPGIGYTYAGMRVPGTYNGQPYSACDQAARDYFRNGLYWNELVFTISEDDPGYLFIGVDKPWDDYVASFTDTNNNCTYGDWIVMDNWRLLYYGGGEIDPDAIKGVESDEINKTAPASKYIYNMLGQRLSKAQKGVNIIGGRKVLKK